MLQARMQTVRLAAGLALLAAAAGLWLSGARPGQAASATQDQSVSLVVPSSISWGATSCTNSLANSATISSSAAAGSTATSSEYTGCITSNAAWSVQAQVLSSLTNGTDTIPDSSVKVEAVVTSLPVGSITTCTAVLPCGLGSAQTVVNGALLTGKSFGVKYHVAVPSTASAGTYDGTIRWTASS